MTGRMTHRRRSLCLVVAMTTMIAVGASAQSTVTLKIKSQQPVANGVRLTLESGTTITVPAADLVVAESAPKPSDADAIIRGKCAKQWATEFSMRAFCEKTEHESVDKLNARPMTSADQRTIRRTCATQWPDEFTMRNFCEEQELDALKKLGR